MVVDRAGSTPLLHPPAAPEPGQVAALRAELAAALAREQDLADTFENGAVPMHWVGPDGTILRANWAELSLVGYDESEYVGHHIAEFHADPSAVEALLRRLHAGETVRDYPAVLRRRDGELRHVLIDSSVLREDGRFVHTRCFTRDVTAQVRASEELRLDRERFVLAAEATEDLIWDWDVVAGTVTWTGATPLYFDRPQSGPGGGQDRAIWAQRVHPDDLPHTEAAARAAFLTGARAWRHEYRFRRTDGTWATMLERASIVRDPAGHAVRAVGAMQDVTERKVAQEATLRLAAIVASASDAIVGKTTDGIITSWNAAAERLFGYAEAEVVGRSVFMLVPPELHAVEQNLLERVRRGERVEYSTTERLRRDGTRLAVSLTVSPIWDPAGRVVGVSSIQRDITDRQRAADELARREQRYRALALATTSIVWTTDPDGGFAEAQPGWERYTGQPWQAYRGVGWLDALHPDDRARVAQDWLDARQRAAVYETEGRLWHHESGRYRRFVSRAAPVRDPEGEVREWIGTLTDVEEQQAAEERLRQAERLESIGRLAGGVAHEANNQMTVVLGAAAFLLHRLRDPQAREDVEHVRRAAQRTAAITQQLLAFRRRQIFQVDTLQLNDIVRQLEPVLLRAVGETSRLATRLDPALGTVRADRGQLEQVLLNLTLNARDAMPGGGVVTIETANVVLDTSYVEAKGLEAMRPGPYALLAVSDTGHGMDRETLDHVFEPFFTTKAVGEGTGLGLATVYGIVRQSGGFIWAYSEPGHGTAFKIYLPLLQAAASQRGRMAAPAIQGGRETVLLAEDDDAVRDVLARSLREYGYAVLEARDGHQALELALAAPAPPDLVVADVVMPGLAGQGLSIELHKRWPGLPVLFTSGYTSLDSMTRGLLTEGRDFLQKPIEPEGLAAKVRAMLDADKPRE
jgi:PAS domain S-box-containing protein